MARVWGPAERHNSATEGVGDASYFLTRTPKIYNDYELTTGSGRLLSDWQDAVAKTVSGACVLVATVYQRRLRQCSKQ